MATDVRVMVPRVRRALENAGAPTTLSDDELKDRVADAIAAISLYTHGSWGKTLTVSEVDDDNVPVEYEVDPALTLEEQTVIAAQAALDWFFLGLVNKKMSERIADEGTSWEYTLSPNLVRDALKTLQGERDKALAAIEDDTGPLDHYESFLAVRDQAAAAVLEPWVFGLSVGGQERDYRFE